jgi:hypothetical protein|tara:strand:- start:6804 stop:7181 length:378 start_codon:yes stop_codon:yes gene_type:complete
LVAIPSSGSIPRPVIQFLAFAFAALIAIAIGSQFLWTSESEAPSTTRAPAPVTTTTRPPYWMNKYGWDYKAFIDSLASIPDCSGLHSEYIRAMRGNANINAQFGTGTADLMEYIFNTQDNAGCFG